MAAPVPESEHAILLVQEGGGHEAPLHTHRMVCTAMLGCALIGCGDRPSIVEPRASVPVLQQGGPPTPVETGQVVDEGASAICGFPVLVEVTGKLKLLELPGGRTILIAPGFNETFTNGNTGTTLTLNLTGPIQNNPVPGGGTELVFLGHNVVGDPDSGFLVLLVGRFSAVFGTDGTLVQPLDGNGQRSDLCALLA